MNLFLEKAKEDKILKIKVIHSDEVICEYCIDTTKKVSQIGERLGFTTLTLWAMLDFCLTNTLLINLDLLDFERKYIEDCFNFCTKLYKNNYNLEIAKILFLNNNETKQNKSINMQDKYFLGFTGGKDSTLCKILLEELQKNVVNYNVSYDDDITIGEGRIYNSIRDKDIYNKFTITGYKSNSNIISFQQADDIHVTFVAPYLYEREDYPANLAVGLPYDAIHCFKTGEPDLVPTETFKSISMLENLMHNYGFNDFKVVSPIATLHTFGVYSLLKQIIGLNELMKLDSCWETNSENKKPCGMCPKCQRLKYVFKNCFGYDYLEDYPTLNITSADFLFGSIHANELLKKYGYNFVSTRQFLHPDLGISNEFVDLIKNKYKFDICNTPNINFVQDNQTWDNILEQIVSIIGLDYRMFSDKKINSSKVKYLPFEKYYNWGRVNFVSECYDILNSEILCEKKYQKKLIKRLGEIDGNKQRSI